MGLIIERTLNEIVDIMVDDLTITIQVIKIQDNNSVKLRFEVPQKVKILRKELCRKNIK